MLLCSAALRRKWLECPTVSTGELLPDMTKRVENAEFLAVGWKTHP
jgi:hypothetical protein